MIRVAAYCRVSTDKEDQANSFEAQQRFFREYIERNPAWVLQEIYADEGISGTSTKKRVQFNRMIRAAQEGNIDLIVTKEVSRFARNTVDTLAYTRDLRQRGVGVLFLNDNINTMDADGELRLTIMSSIAQEESRKTSDRVKWGQKRRMEQGVVFGGSLLGYDVVGGKLSVNPQGAETVRYIFHKYLDERKGSSVIARELREEGILSSRGNLKWSASTVLKILKNEKYCGDLIQQKTYTPDYLSHTKKYNRGQQEFVVLRDHHEPIIDRATWDIVQRELTRRRINCPENSSHGNRYPLSGKLKCAVCGSSFVSRTKRTSAGIPYRVWRCGKAALEGKLHTDAQGASRGCGIGRQIREEPALEMLQQAVNAVPIDRDAVINGLSRIVEDVLKDSRDDAGTELRRLNRELEAEQEKKQRALEEFFDKTISKADFQFINQRCDAKISRLQKQIHELEDRHRSNIQSAGTGKSPQAVISSIVNGKSADMEFYGQLLRQMTIHSDGKVEITLHFLSARWYFALDGLAEYKRQTVPCDSSVPISVSNPFSSA